jgi:hypothetical protein
MWLTEVGQRSGITMIHFNIMQFPALRLIGPVANVYNAGRFVRTQSYAKTIERRGQSFSKGLDVRLFSGPTKKERFVAVMNGKGLKIRGFFRAEEALCDTGHIIHPMDALDVHPKFLLESERQQRHGAGTGHVKSDRMVAGQRWLPFRESPAAGIEMEPVRLGVRSSAVSNELKRFMSRP